ncbi:MAG: NADH:flavin oxidoreductase [Nitrospirae bacterium]|nr:NADH:flavin oxidoreductase [Nitrospirota bacterium]
MLFDPFFLRDIKLKNRLVRSATYEKRADERGFVTDALIEFYEALAWGGVGLIITGNAMVHPSGVSVDRAVCVYDDAYIPGLRRLAHAIHRFDGKVVMQITHGGRQCYPDMLGDNPPIAPSEVYEPMLRVTPRAMTEEEIWEVIRAFGSAAKRVQAAGFDGVQIHGAHGYLVSEFLSSHTNRRDDYWGGDEERRFHFLQEVVKAIRGNVDVDYPVLIKMNSADFLETGGLTPQESLSIAKKLQGLGVDAIEISGGMFESDPSLKPAREDILKAEDEAYFKETAAMFKKELDIPVILVGGMRSKAVCEGLLAGGYADLISLSRPLIREPDLPDKFRDGKEKADCISCNGCMRFKKLDMVRCIQIKD